MPSMYCVLNYKVTIIHVFIHSLLWHCRLGVMKSIQPVKIAWWGVGVVICLQRGADCLHTVQLMPLHPETPSSLASFKSRLVLPFWYHFAQVVLEKRPLNECSSGSIHVLVGFFQPDSAVRYFLPTVLWISAWLYTAACVDNLFGFGRVLCRFLMRDLSQ